MFFLSSFTTSRCTSHGAILIYPPCIHGEFRRKLQLVLYLDFLAQQFHIYLKDTLVVVVMIYILPGKVSGQGNPWWCVHPMKITSGQLSFKSAVIHLFPHGESNPYLLVHKATTNQSLFFPSVFRHAALAQFYRGENVGGSGHGLI